MRNFDEPIVEKVVYLFRSFESMDYDVASSTVTEMFLDR